MSKRRMAMERLLTTRSSEDTAPTPVRVGAVKTMGLALLDMEEGKRAGDRVIEIATDAIDPSFVRDRLDDAAGGDAVEGLMRSIEDGGQLVPILVRPHPDDPERYQIAYGHRRWRACARLGRPVRALVRSLTDDALLLAQGRENNARQDLTFIERAQFAAALMEKGMTRAMVCGALGVDKSELTRFLSVANGLPEGLAARIGRAPRAGRPRWMKLLALVHDKGEAAVMAAMDTVSATDSDQRFKGLLATLEADQKASPHGTTRRGYKSGPVNVMRSGQQLSITIDERRAPGFGVFVEERLAALLAEYHASSATLSGAPTQARMHSI